jgi:alkyldihydroxyacetonephosphate synthase
MRLQDRPVHKASAAVTFTNFADAIDATRKVAQSGLQPANCRLLDPGEAALSGASTDGSSVLVLGFESAYVPVDSSLNAATDLAASCNGMVQKRADAVSSWRSAFLKMPYIRDGLARMSGITETFETACRWRDVPALVDAVRTEVGAAVRSVCGVDGMINCRFTHVYPDGAAPYFTVIAAGRRGSELAMWDEIKAAAGDVLSRSGATITHHHAVGRDHRPWYDKQRPDVFAAALTAAKASLDPQHILNPGVLIH